MTAEDCYFPAGSADLRYRDAGRGPPVVFVHGWSLDLDMWEPQVAALLPLHRVIRWDRRGFGLSGGRPAIESDVADIRALCQHLDIQRAAFVGMSQGVRVICALAVTEPSLISCLVFDGSPDLTGRPGLTNDVPLDRYRTLVRDRDVEVFRREWQTHPMAQLRTREHSVNELLRTMLARYPATDLLQTQAAGMDMPMVEAVIAARIPALVINGEFDLHTRKEAGEALARVLPGSQYVAIPNAGHLPNLDNPAAYNAVLRFFLGRYQQHL